MYTLQIEHGIKDFGMWKAAFDQDPVDRVASGVVAYRISRPVDDPHYVVVELDFESRAQAESLLARLQDTVWNTDAAPALRGTPKTRILESAG
jgi:ribosomal protein L35AE/L33A